MSDQLCQCQAPGCRQKLSEVYVTIVYCDQPINVCPVCFWRLIPSLGQVSSSAN